MSKPNFDDPNQVFDYLKNKTGQFNQKQYDLSGSTQSQAQILLDNSVSAAMFKPHPEKKNVYYANELTIRAMRKDLFILDEQMLDISQETSCSSCQKKYDLQFWEICPYCGKKNLIF